MRSNLTSAVASVAADTGRTLAILREVGAIERDIFLTELRRLNIARWAVAVHRLAADHPGDFSPEDVQQARRLARTLVLEVAA